MRAYILKEGENAFLSSPRNLENQPPHLQLDRSVLMSNVCVRASARAWSASLVHRSMHQAAATRTGAPSMAMDNKSNKTHDSSVFRENILINFLFFCCGFFLFASRVVSVFLSRFVFLCCGNYNNRTCDFSFFFFNFCSISKEWPELVFKILVYPRTSIL